MEKFHQTVSLLGQNLLPFKYASNGKISSNCLFSVYLDKICYLFSMLVMEKFRQTVSLLGQNLLPF